MRTKQFTFGLILIVSITQVVAGCGPNAAPIPVATPVPTNSAVPTNMPLPTATATSTPAPSTTPTVTQVPTRTPLPTATVTATPLPDAVLFSDKFVDNRNGWSIGPSTDFDAEINGGHLSVALKTLNNILIVPVPKNLPADVDVTFETFVEHNSGPGMIVGAICRDQKDLNFYLFQVNIDKGSVSVAIFKVTNGEIHLLAAPPASQVIEFGQATNNFRMVCFGNRFQLSLNGTALVTVKDDSFKDGTVALASGALAAGAKVAFGNLVIKVPETNAIKP